MKPYFQDADVTIFHGDCREILPTLAPVDLVLTDPPYNAGISYGEGTNDKVSWSEYGDWLKSCLVEMERLSKGLVLCFVSVNGLKQMAITYPPKHICVWNKPMSFSPRLGGSAFLPHWEPCLVYGTLHGEGGRVPDYHLSDVWTENIAERNGHPCPKPVALMRRIIKDVPGTTILDPFMGSGTTLRAAKDLGRKAIGIEIEERYCEIAAERMSQAVMELVP